MVYIQDIGFVGHCHYAHTASGTVPVEIALSCLRDPSSACITVDITSERFTSKNYQTNQWIFRNQSKLPFPYKGKYSLDKARAVIKRLYAEKDAGQGLYMAVKGHSQMDFFKSCGLPVCEIKTEVLGDCPKYDELPIPSEQLNKPCEIHLAGDDYRCSKRVAFAFARYLESREGDQLLVLQPDEMDDDGEVNESVIIQMNRDETKPLCFVKNNIHFTILLK
ncbi:hypothetical protein CEXT_516921 [Caerostris extrusa]|uniref:Uncharacterized protein n=1 Tax=Caerostris extrusa TaxID=172846 RepID=A0AAV4YD28_CAEEX|nr:hypothetical protein CEXT_516921 [Caerostris extrusa]